MAERSGWPTLSALEWTQRLRQRMGVPGLPLMATLELTERCNLRCVHCYINRPAGDEEARRRELTLEEWKDVLDQMAQTGVLWLLVTGGEPLLRPDFGEFYLYARRKGFHVTLFTNGTLLTPELADLLAEYPPWETEITLYGATVEAYERITGVPGSHARCYRGVDTLLQGGLSLNLKTMALTLNVGELPAMRRFAEERAVFFRYDPVIQSRLDGCDGPLAYRLAPEEIVALERRDPKRVKEWQEFCARPWARPDPECLFSCGAALHTFHLDPYGGLYPCLTTRWLRYDLRSGSMAEALRDFLPEVRRLRVRQNHTCWRCDLRAFCQNCPAWAQREVGDPEAPEPFRCRLTHMRNQDLELSVHVV